MKRETTELLEETIRIIIVTVRCQLFLKQDTEGPAVKTVWLEAQCSNEHLPSMGEFLGSVFSTEKDMLGFIKNFTSVDTCKRMKCGLKNWRINLSST